ncbi:glycosyltransferase [Oenococcus sicerae]|nr:glycosyltransferase [Oenococcus sicerae]
MFYFTSENIFSFNSGTEFSQAKRTRLFNLHGQKAVYVTRNYNNNLHQGAKQLALTDDEVLNMYDYFQKAVHLPRKKMNVRFTSVIPKRDYQLQGVDPNYSLIKYQGRTLARVNIAPLSVGLVGNIDYYDSFGNTTATDYWDWRGFKSSTQYYHPDGQPSVQRFYSPMGDLMLEIIRMNISGKLFPTMYKLFNYRGGNWRFDSENDLFVFFMNELLAQQPGSTIINDRPNMAELIARTSGAAKKFQYLHDVHTVDASNPIHGKLMPVLEPLFKTYAAAFDGVILPTIDQKRDLSRRFPKITFYQAPDTFIGQTQKSVSPKILHRVLYFGRLSEEKRPEQAIRAFSIVKDAIPDTILEFCGYPSSAEFLAKLKKQIRDADLENSILFHDYVTGQARDQVLNRAEIVLQSSTGEGFSMSVLEAMSHGLPAVVYDVNYGPRTFIRNGQNGYLIKNGNFAELAESVIKILKDPAVWKTLSIGAYQTAQAFNSEQVWQLWQNTGIIKEAR